MPDWEYDSDWVAELATMPGLDAVVEEVAATIAATAKVTAPVETGAYRDSISVTNRVGESGRPVCKVEAADPKSRLIESRTGNLARAARSVRSRR